MFDFGTGDFTIELWVNYKDLTGEQVLIGKFLTYVGPGWSVVKMEYNAFRFATNCCDEIDVFPPALEINTWVSSCSCSEGRVKFHSIGTVH